MKQVSLSIASSIRAVLRSTAISAAVEEITAGLPTMPNTVPPSMRPEGGGLFPKTVYEAEQYSLADVLQLKDMYLFEALMESAELLHENPLALPEQLTASITPREVFNSQWTPFFLFCYRVLPVFLNMKFSYEYGAGLAKALLSKVRYENALDDAIGVVKSVGLMTNAVNLAFKSLARYPANQDALLSISVLFKALKPKVRAKLETSAERTLFLRFFYVFTDDEANEAALNEVFRIGSRIPNLTLRRFVKSVKLDVNVVEYRFLTARQSVADITRKTFGTPDPTQAQIEKLYKKKPNVYKDWRKQMNEVSRRGKALLAEAWEQEGLDTTVPAEVARKLCEEVGITSPIDPAFEGLVSLGATPGVMFTYYTKYGLEIEGSVGYNVIMNPKYTEADNTYVCTCRPAAGISSKEYRFYTKDYRARSTGQLFTKARAIVDVIEDVRITITQDMKKGDWNPRCLAALVSRVIDLTSARIGNRGSEASGVFGIHNLQVKHLKFLEKGGLRIAYLGKRKIPHKHIITDPLTVRIIKALIEGRKPSDFVFSTNGKIPVSVVTVNKYLKSIGFPGTAHTWRKYHANTIFQEAIKRGYDEHAELMKASMKKKGFEPTEPDTLAIFKAAVDEVAETLQNTASVCIRSYIDANLMMNVFVADSKKPPKSVENAFKARKDLNPDEEVED